MALWYDCGRGLVKAIGFARGELGADVYICCPGPSLANIDPESLRMPGAFVIGVNTAYPHIRPDVWVGMDTPGCYDPRLWWEPFPKIVRGSYQYETCAGVPIRTLPNVFFADVEQAYVTDLFRRRSHYANFVWNRNTFIVALHLAVWIGGRHIHFVGCDFGGAADYHDDRVLPENQRDSNRQLYSRLVGLLPRLRDAAERNGIELISCTPDSPANDHLPFVSLGDAIEKSQRRVPSIAGCDVLHANQARLCRWPRDFTPCGNGVMTGADAMQECLLPLWWDRYAENNGHPVAFADFGMSAKMRAWCGERGLVVNVPSLPGRDTRHCKPFAILASPFRRTIWLDADCEVRGDLSMTFPYADRGIGMTLDPHSRRCHHPDTFATDIVAVTHGEPAVEEWAKEILLNDHSNDQEAINAIRERLADRATMISDADPRTPES